MKHKSTPTYDDKKQVSWEIWFIISCILEAVYIFVGTLDYSVEYFPNWWIFATVVTVNLVACIIYGVTKKY